MDTSQFTYFRNSVRSIHNKPQCFLTPYDQYQHLCCFLVFINIVLNTFQLFTINSLKN